CSHNFRIVIGKYTQIHFTVNKSFVYKVKFCCAHCQFVVCCSGGSCNPLCSAKCINSYGGIPAYTIKGWGKKPKERGTQLSIDVEIKTFQKVYVSLVNVSLSACINRIGFDYCK